MPKLVCLAGPHAGQEFVLHKDEIVLGRQSSCDVQVPDPAASRAHCQLRRDGVLWSLVDLGSRNGTQHNNKKISGERLLIYGDLIRIGQIEFRFEKVDGDTVLSDLLPKYEVRERLGEGGMGIVFKAVQRSMERIVALKILSPRYARKPQFVEQFVREARAAGQLSHPNIIQVHEVGSDNGIHYFSMEFVDGPTCMQRLREHGPLTVEEALHIVRQVASALAYAHEHRIIHYDIKPDNILLAPGNLVKLADLGISKTFEEVERAPSEQARIMGTPHYLAPEAGRGQPTDHRVDIYALGATLYHLLTGKTPYHGTSAADIIRAHIHEPLPPLQDLNPDVPDTVCAFVERMMAKRPEDRYGSAAEVIAEIDRLQSGAPLGRDRISGGETMILQRFASGKPASPIGSAAGMPTVEVAQPTRVRRQPSPAMRYAVWGMIGLGGVIAVIVAAKLAFQQEAPMSAAAEATAGTVVRSAATSATGDRAPALPDENRRDPRLPAIAARLGQAAAKQDEAATAQLYAIDAELAELETAKLSQLDRQLLVQLRQQVADELRRRQLDADRAAWRVIESECAQLMAACNWELAVRRIESFRAKEDPEFRNAVERLRFEIAEHRRRYLEGLEARIAAARSQRSLPRLRELRENLPSALLGGEHEQRLSAAIAELEEQQRQALLVECSAAAADLVRWDFARVRERHARLRPLLGETAQGRQLDQYLAAAEMLPRFVEAIAAELRRGPLPYVGTLGGWNNPKIDAATSRGLTLLVASGAVVEVPWAKLEPSDLAAFGRSVLKAGFEAFRPAINALMAARVEAGR
ncbi:MAG: protein kinase [Rhodocyclaceae bacterium]|nr:protein kinase [Rhodocyclaceae bacterium]